mmetsp:Transcript_8263/g.17971  ORF Transcript_8263/g.17971 Transcript_8263/m.17971 type:complete len:92 (+) Transcript_8263:808-1083(+)
MKQEHKDRMKERDIKQRKKRVEDQSHMLALSSGPFHAFQRPMPTSYHHPLQAISPSPSHRNIRQEYYEMRRKTYSPFRTDSPGVNSNYSRP